MRWIAPSLKDLFKEYEDETDFGVLEMITIELPIRLYSVANLGEHWSTKMKRNQAQGLQVTAAMREALSEKQMRPKDRFIITLTRIGPKTLDDDNLASAFKKVRDCVARALGIDDKQTLMLRWIYEQEKSKEYGIRIEIRTKRNY